MSMSVGVSARWVAGIGWMLAVGSLRPAAGQPSQAKYYGRPAVEDAHGVVAPWYAGQNGQCDFRVRVAAETMKRYPWSMPPKTNRPAPDYVYNGRWKIAPEGTITRKKLDPWGNGDLAQRGAYATFGWIDYYRYTGDPAAIAHIWLIADVLLHHCQTGADHAWPGFLISVPNRGEPYGDCDPRGMIQLDLAAFYGLALVRAYQITGEGEWLAAASRWGDLLAAKRTESPGRSPWNRYANPEDVFWEDRQTGGVVVLLMFFDELIRVGHTGADNAIVAARDAGRAYLRDVLLPAWTVNDTFGRDYWDWNHPVQSETLSELVPRYLMANAEAFPNWRVDARNILSLYLQRACVSPESNGDVYSGAWAYPEGSQCCGRSLSYAPMQVGAAFAEYGVRADSAWGRELARRQFLLATYDAHETGVVEDNIDGGQEVAGGWFQIAHPLPLKYVLDGIAWLPETLGANRENHIVRSSAVVKRVRYGDGRIEYETFDAPRGTVEVLRLAFRPVSLTADGHELKAGEGYAVKELGNSDCLVTVRHDGARTVVIEGDDPQRMLDDAELSFEGAWRVERQDGHHGGTARVAAEDEASVTVSFEGNQVRLIGAVGPDGGLADVFLDGVRQLCGIDAWNPYAMRQQVLWYRSGLSDGSHTLRMIARGSRNPRSQGERVCVDAVQVSAAKGDAGFGEGGGPTGAQRWVFGYTERGDYVDTQGRSWRPATEAVIRMGDAGDSVASWYTTPRRLTVAGTKDPTLYAHGMRGRDFTAYFTVAPGEYHVRIKLMESRWTAPEKRLMNIAINDEVVVRRMDVAATAAGRPSTVLYTAGSSTPVYEGLNRAVDLVFDGVKPRHGVIAVRFTGEGDSEAIVSAIEVGPGPGGPGMTPICVRPPAATQSTDEAKSHEREKNQR